MKKLVVLIALSGLLAGCGDKEKTFRVALALPLTGDIAALGEGMKRSADLAVAEANASGDFKYRIDLRAFDDHADPKEAVNIANQIVSDSKISIVVGHFNSGCSIPAAKIYAKAGMAMINPASTNPKLTLQQLEPSWEWDRNVFRVNTTDDVQGQYAANYVRQKLKLKTVSVIQDKTSYGQGLAEEFQKAFKEEGGVIKSFDGITIGDKDFKSLLTKIKDLKPDMIYFGGIYNEGGLILRQARELGIHSVFFSGDALQSPELFSIAGDAAGIGATKKGKNLGSCYLTNVGVPPSRMPTARDFLDRYKKAYPGVDFQPYDHYSYEATRIALHALKEAGIQNPDDTIVDKSKIINFLKDLKYDGVLGRTEFDEKGDTKNKTITVYLVKDGKFLPVN